jgi:hypothetical protein
MKSIAIMQPYFLSYIGYFQLINEVDEFIVYDNIQFTKRGWIHRNRILENGKDVFISLPLKKDSDFLNVNKRYLADDFDKQRIKLLNKIKNNYRKAPFFEDVFPLVKKVLYYDDNNLFQFILNSIIEICNYLGIKTPIKISSTINIDHSLKGAEKVKAIVKALKADVYINPIGGVDLYNKMDFANDDIDLKFIKTNEFEYCQFDENNFIPFLSIIDVMMFKSKKLIQEESLKQYNTL